MTLTKKLSSLLLVPVLALTVGMAGCGSESTTETESDEGTTAAVELSGTVSTNGSTSMESVIGTLAEQFMIDNPNVTVTYDPTGSGTGIESASNGSCDIGLASRALKDEETGLEGTIVALDGIAIIVNADNGIEDLTVDEIAQIFTGEITNWSELGGADLEIACIGRESGSGTRDGFESVTGTENACVLAQELTSTGAVIAAVSSNANAIGYASLSAVAGQDGINVVSVDGVVCSEDTILDGTYAIQRPFVLVTREDSELSDAAQAFFDFAISEDAADLIRQAGAVPLV